MDRGKILAKEKTFFPVICRKNNIPEYKKLQLLLSPGEDTGSLCNCFQLEFKFKLLHTVS